MIKTTSLFQDKMLQANLPPEAISVFAQYYRQLCDHHTGFIPETALEPVVQLPVLSDLKASFSAWGEAHLAQTVVIKLNGGLGTSMGLEQAKTRLIAKNGMTFLDIIAHQARHFRLPLVLMNTLASRRDSLRELRAFPWLKSSLPLDFLQHRVPKIRQDNLLPVNWPANSELEWAPPGHGDIYLALMTSGLLDKLLALGYRYAFVANSDNLGAVFEPRLLGYLGQNKLPFLMEVTLRTALDRKGGHVARRLSDQHLILREVAQCPVEEMEAFQDNNRYCFFNTNNLWFDLQYLADALAAKRGFLDLPMIRNAKTVDPRDPTSLPVYQLETAMGSAISVFPRAQAIVVPRTRFAPVKTTNELLILRSDIYALVGQAVLHRSKAVLPVVNLDPQYYKLIDDFEKRFTNGVPSLKKCFSLTVEGDVYFGKNVQCVGDVKIINTQKSPVSIANDTVIKNVLTF